MASAPPTPDNLKRIVAASLIGTTIEWYDNSSDQSYDLLFSRHCPFEVSTEPAPDILVPGEGPRRVRSGQFGTRPQTPKKVTRRSKLAQSDAEPCLDDSMERAPAR
jgi:hypothetical protein